MMQPFLWGALAMGAAISGLFFCRFWRRTSDRLFLAFAAAFWLLALQWGALALLRVADESRHYLFLLRLAAFVLILVAVVDKNRER